MPLYDYACAACARRFEVIHGVHDEGPASCPLCAKGPVRKVITAASVHYKGSGWAKKERRATVKTGASSGDDDGPSEKGSSSSEAGTSTAADSSSDGSGASPQSPPTAPTGEPSKGSHASAKTGPSSNAGSSTSSRARTAD